jgi:ketosteroid isomerase-like protein
LFLPPASGESEVRQFLARYTDRYNHKDIEGFISFFSPKAVQNQKDDIEKIRKVYASFFQHNEELRYKISNLKIEPHKNGLQVMADYELEGILKKGRERKVWKGQVRWVLIEEKGALKVFSLDYQSQKSRD